MIEKNKFRERFLILDSVPLGMCVLESDMTVVFWNNFMEDYVGITKSDIEGRKLSDRYPHLAESKYSERFDEVSIHGATVIFSTQLHRYILPVLDFDGKYQLQNTTLAPIEHTDGKKFLILMCIEDVTDQVHQIQLFRQAHNHAMLEKEKAEEASKVKTQFLANMSHELRNPLHGILSCANFGLQKTDVDEEKRLSYFENIKKCGEHLLVLLNNILDLSKLEAGKVFYEFKPVDIGYVVSTLLSEMEAYYREKGISVVFNQPQPPAVAEIDEIKILQVFRNILNNTVNFSPSKGTVHIKVVANPDDIIVLFVDRGIGIPEKELKTVFEKFEQSSKTRTGAGGTGLGLTISKQIILDHGGKIWAEQNPEGGTILKVIIPKKHANETVRYHKIGEILIKDSTITKQQLDKALNEQKAQASTVNEESDGTKKE